MMNHYCNILEQITENTSQLIIDVELITKKEISVIKNVFNNTEEIFEKTKPINQFFEQQAKSNPNKIAAIFCDEKITYRELNEKANQLGRFLVQKGVKKGDTIGVIKYFTETGQVIGSVDIISANDVDNISFITKIKMIFTD